MPARPNILWIVTTQWRAQATGYAGDANARTPWLDGLASEAIDYAQAVTPHPLGPQARAALLTGRLADENGVRDYWDPLPATGRTVAHALRERGYTTGFFGKWHLAPRDRGAPFVGEAHAKTLVAPERRGGFDFWEGFEGGFLLNDPWLHGSRLASPQHFKGYQADLLCGRAAHWVAECAGKNADGTRPCFAVVSLETPHPPYHGPAPHVQPPPAAGLKLRPNVPTGGPVEQQARDELSGYYAHIEATDRAIGKLLAEVDLAGTIVLFTSVHGDMHGSHGLFRKAWPYEESIRVPLLVRRPKVPARRDNSPVSLVDLAHMTLAWAEGREWVCHRDNASIAMPTPTAIPLQCPEAWRGFRSARHKLVLRRTEAGAEKPWLYFDLERDPFELVNLAYDPARSDEINRLVALM